MQQLRVILTTIVLLISITGTITGQSLFDSFTDGEFSTSPAWAGNTTAWTVVANSDVAAGATGSNTLRLNAPATSQTEYLSSQINYWGTGQEWGFWIGRRNQALTSTNQSQIWLYATETNLNSSTVDGYRIVIGDNSGPDEIVLQYIVDGMVSATVITSSAGIPNGLTDIGFLLRVTRSAAGAWEIFTSPLPTGNGSGAVATSVPNAANASISQGTGTNNSLVPATNGFIGVAASHTTTADPITGAEFDQIYFTPSGSAASAVIGGRLADPRGKGLPRVLLMLTGGDLTEPVYAKSNSFGYYVFDEVTAGQTYVVQVISRRYTFDQTIRVIPLETSVRDIDFTARGER